MPWRRWPSARRAPDGPEDAWQAARERMVHAQIESRGLDDPELLRAFRAVPRHAFVDSEDPYGDRALGIGSGQTISQPYVVAAMTWLGRPRRGWRGARILEIGTGSGYAVAILAELGAEVVTMERHASLAADALERLRNAGYPGVRCVVGDGSLGFPDAAPYDSILVTAASPDAPDPLVNQLQTDGGRLVIPIGSREKQWLTVVERHGETTTRRAMEPVVFVPLVGAHGFPG